MARPFLAPNSAVNMSKQWILALGIVICVSVVFLWWNAGRISATSERAMMAVGARDVDVPKYYLSYRPGKIDLQRVIQHDIRLNGQDFYDPHHTISYSQASITGQLQLGKFEGPSKLRMSDIYVHLREGAPNDDDWWLNGKNSRAQHCWHVGVLEEGRLEGDAKSLKKYFPPGEYCAEMYLEICDLDEGQNEVYLIGRTNVTLREDQ